jgi:hypothetical protein
MRVIPRTNAMDMAEGELANALAVGVGGTMPRVSPSEILQHLV